MLDLKLVDGNSIHVEEISSSESPRAIEKIFDRLNNSVQLYVQMCEGDGEGGLKIKNAEETNITIDQRKSVLVLRSILAERFDLNPDLFKILKSKLLSAECVNSSKSLQQNGFFDGQKIYILVSLGVTWNLILFQEGKPMTSSEISVSFMLFNREHYSFNKIGEEIFVKETTVQQLRSVILAACFLASVFLTDLSECSRIRPHPEPEVPSTFSEESK